jgi:hypothetical protein
MTSDPGEIFDADDHAYEAHDAFTRTCRSGCARAVWSGWSSKADADQEKLLFRNAVELNERRPL